MIAVDTNIVTGMLKGEIVDLPENDLFVPFIVQAELLAGIANGTNKAARIEKLNNLLSDPHITCSSGLPSEVIQPYADIYSYLKINGTPISPNDLWIAAECMSLSMPLMTLDKDFDNVPQIIKV